jgi:hypothetical protein
MKDFDWISLAQNGVWWRALIDTKMKFRVQRNEEFFEQLVDYQYLKKGPFSIELELKEMSRQELN